MKIDPSTGRLPALVKIAEARLAARPPANYDDPESRPLGERCILGLDGGQPVTPPIVPNLYFGNFYQIVQTPKHVMIFTEQVHDARIIRIGGTHAPAALRRWLGDSIGQWDGDTLVVDTVNIHELAAFRGATTKIHVDDPDTWSQPWTLEFPFVASTKRPFEYACHEGNRAVEGVLRGARAEEKAKKP